jgi:hypothetical protein
VFRAETDVVGTLTRTQLNGPDDSPNVEALQARYELIPLSRVTGSRPPQPAPPVAWPAWDPVKAEGIGFISYLNALLPLMPTVPSERAIMARFARIGIGPGLPFDPNRLDPATRSAIEAGVSTAAANLRSKALAQSSSKGFFGTREELGPDYLTYRAMGAMLGIYGNSSAEALYVCFLTRSFSSAQQSELLNGGAASQGHMTPAAVIDRQIAGQPPAPLG